MKIGIFGEWVPAQNTKFSTIRAEYAAKPFSTLREQIEDQYLSSFAKKTKKLKDKHETDIRE